MARKATARKAVIADEGRDNPERPDVIPTQDGDDLGAVVDINTGKAAKDDTIDVNAAARDDDARSDAVKAEEREREEQERQRQANANADEPPPRGEDDDEGAPRSRAAQRRENREREARRRSDEKVTNLTAQNKAMRERLAKLERAGNEKQIEGSIKAMEAEISACKTELAAAIETGDTAKQLDLTIKLGEVQGRLAVARRDLEVAKATPVATATDADGEEEPTGKTPEIVNDWTKANRKWWNLPSAEKLHDAAIAIDKQIREEIKDGELDFAEYSEDHMDELTLRLAEEQERLGLNFEIKDFEGEVFKLDDQPEETDRDRGDRKDAANGRDRETPVRGNDRGTRRSPQGGLGGREGRRGAQSDLELARQGKARLTAEDYEQMRIFKLDSNDPDVRKRFAKERVRTILTEAQKGAK